MKKSVQNDYEREIVTLVREDYENRKRERKKFEAQWKLNTNFLMGNQYCEIRNGEVEESIKQFGWENREVFNHIAPLVEVRLSKLNRVKPQMTVIPHSSDIADIETAKLSKSILSACSHRLKLSSLINEATNISECCGSVFYKVIWQNDYSKVIGKNEKDQQVYDGDLKVVVCSPYEIYPFDNSISKLSDNPSIIHAKAYPISEIKSIWGVDVKGENVEIFSVSSNSSNMMGVANEIKKDYAVVIEKYEMPTDENKNGKLTIVAGDKLLYEGELPYVNEENGKRGYPFVKQTVNDIPGCFWGVSVIERCIPIQRAYNAVKNRKYEYMNRLSMGVLTVEDGSVDTDMLEEDGLEPGKVIIYRQGSNPPRYMVNNALPNEFSYEEERLLNEFMVVSGVSDLMRNSQSNVSNMSGTALSLLIEQDDNRILTTVDNIKNAIKEIGKHILRLYKQFAVLPRCTTKVNENGSVERFYFKASDICSDDIAFETETEITQSISQKRANIFELIGSGLLNDENGKISSSMRLKILKLLDYGVWDNSYDIGQLHTSKAQKENICFLKDEKVFVSEIDDHELHIKEHIAYILSLESDLLTKNQKMYNKMLEHIREHKKFNKLTNQINTEQGE